MAVGMLIAALARPRSEYRARLWQIGVLSTGTRHGADRVLARDAVRMSAHISSHFDALTRNVATRFRAKGRTDDMEEDRP